MLLFIIYRPLLLTAGARRVLSHIVSIGPDHLKAHGFLKVIIFICDMSMWRPDNVSARYEWTRYRLNGANQLHAIGRETREGCACGIDFRPTIGVCETSDKLEPEQGRIAQPQTFVNSKHTCCRKEHYDTLPHSLMRCQWIRPYAKLRTASSCAK